MSLCRPICYSTKKWMRRTVVLLQGAADLALLSAINMISVLLTPLSSSQDIRFFSPQCMQVAYSSQCTGRLAHSHHYKERARNGGIRRRVRQGTGSFYFLPLLLPNKLLRGGLPNSKPTGGATGAQNGPCVLCVATLV